MSEELEYGICIFFQSIHYYIPFGKFKHSKNDDIYITIGDRERGGHISLHPSGEKHYRENKGETIPLRDRDFLQPVIDNLNQFIEMTLLERKFVININKMVKAIRRMDGCFDPNCKNRMGVAINFDILQKDYIEYVNKNQKIVKQIFGEILDKVDEDDEEIVENDKMSQIINRMKIEKIPECNICKEKSRIKYNKKKKKFVWKKCPRCKGLGFDLVYLEQYKQY